MTTEKVRFRLDDYIIAVLPLIPAVIAAFYIEHDETVVTIYTSAAIAVGAFLLTNSLVPVISEYTLKKGLSGKDMGKKGTAYESRDVPEALGIVSGTAFLISAIFSQLVFAKTFQQLMVFNSGLFSICFMIFLGFTDDTLDLKWRYKLILPTVASLPLLSAYSGSTAVFIPTPFRFLLWSEGGHLTTLGALIDIFATVDSEAHGAIIELGYLFLLFMGLLAVFCTNAINILAGVNGLECGQSYIIACSILLFKLYEISRGIHGDNQMFSVIMILPFIGTSLALLRHNWYPARVFVGDTFCYFAGMTFAVIGIHGHFSKTLLLLFLPQIFNFLYSIPQLFKFIPCPRHRLPKVDPATKLLHCSTFSCKASEYRWFKIRSDDLSCPNYTLICVVLRVFGPMRERTLTVTLLLIQSLSTAVAFYIRYFLLEERS